MFNYFEVVVYIICFIMEGVCDGRGVVELMEVGCYVLMEKDVMEGVFEMLDSI